MKTLLNRAIHGLLKLTHRSAAYTEEEKETYLHSAAEINASLQDWMGSEQYEFVSLGQNCNSAWYLKECGLKKASYPFDWVFTSPEILAHVLNDDFQSFMNKELIIPHGLDAGHQLYHEYFFGHRNPIRSSADYEYYQRGVERWRELMNSQRPAVFVTVVLNEPGKRKRFKDGFTKNFSLPLSQTLDDFEALMEKLQSINPNCKFLFIEQYTEDEFGLEILANDSRAFWLKYTSLDKNTGVQYLHSVDDEVMKVLLSGLKA